MIGYIDESMRQGPTGLYVVGLVIVPTPDHEALRRATRSLLLPGQDRFHWYEERESQRIKMLDHIRAAPGRLMAYACQPVANTKQERARAKCFNRMLWDLLQAGDVDELVVESRREASDKRDRRTIFHAQQAAAAPAGLRYRFDRPGEECLLWLPDAVAGAVATNFDTTSPSSYEDVFGGAVAVVEVSP